MRLINRCPHSRKSGIYGDEINHSGGYRLRCDDCGLLLDGPVSLAQGSPRVIRTLEEVEALDSYALLADKDGGLYNRAGILENVTPENMGKYMPLAVLITRGQFRAAREALEQEK